MPIDTQTQSTELSSSQKTRLALINAALRLFGSKGYAATSTREIAEAASTNISSIAYHFGGKQGLHTACAEYFVSLAKTHVNDTSPATSAAWQSLSQENAEEALISFVGRMIDFLLGSKEAPSFVSFVLREVGSESDAMQQIFEGFIGPSIEQAALMYSKATGISPTAEEAKIAVMSYVGQVFYFRVAQFVVLNSLGWEEIGPEQRKLIKTTLLQKVRAGIAAAREE
ncbi:CerR family C-terminal domain-containing protein [Polycladidibacter hongkongensis]|uniref:CerR family C-terminal domain-containing protein n=1 Tax=Polycladidibacter hongkongensis TaxID=1647556 RepID=UPI00082D7D95|nr:CerR family C-terminal domain-containing protein [Pseudovibrio hongkongensis]